MKREPMSDLITVTGLGGYGYHGVLQSEREEGQQFYVDLALQVNTLQAAATDDLEHTVDYGRLAAEVAAVIEGEPVNLIETLAALIANKVLENSLVEHVQVTVHKPQAPIGVPFKDVQVRIERSQQSAVPDGVGPDPVAEIRAPQVAADPLIAPKLGEVSAPSAAEVVAPEPVAPQVPAPDLNAAPAAPVPVVLALGGNLGNVTETLQAAVRDLSQAQNLQITAIGPLARTEAVLQEGAAPQDDHLNTVVLATTTLSPLGVLALAHEIENTYGRQRLTPWGERTLDIDVITYGDLVSDDDELTLPHPRAAQRAFVLKPWSLADAAAVLPDGQGSVQSVAQLAQAAPDAGGIRWINLDWYEPQSGAEPAVLAAEPLDAEPLDAEPVDAGPAPVAAEPAEAEPVNAEPEAPQVFEPKNPDFVEVPGSQPSEPRAAEPWEGQPSTPLPPSFTPKWAPLRQPDSE